MLTITAAHIRAALAAGERNGGIAISADGTVYAGSVDTLAGPRDRVLITTRGLADWTWLMLNQGEDADYTLLAEALTAQMAADGCTDYDTACEAYAH